MTRLMSRIILVLSLFSLLAGCAIKDDFGRTRPSQLRANAVEVVGSIQEHTGVLSRDAAFHIPFSGSELTIRRTLKHFRLPFISHPNLRNPNQTQTFSSTPSGRGFRAFMAHNIKSDINRVKYFGNAVAVVIQQDQQRYDAISHSYDVKDNDSAYIRVRIRENRAVTMRVMQLLDKRTVNYDKAIEYAGLQYTREEVRHIKTVMDRLRAKIGLLKAKYEAYVYADASTVRQRNVDNNERSK